MSGDHFDTVPRCGEMNSRYQRRLLDIMTQADERELAIVLRNIEELGDKTAACIRSKRRLVSNSQLFNHLLTLVVIK